MTMVVMTKNPSCSSIYIFFYFDSGKKLSFGTSYKFIGLLFLPNQDVVKKKTFLIQRKKRENTMATKYLILDRMKNTDGWKNLEKKFDR